MTSTSHGNQNGVAGIAVGVSVNHTSHVRQISDNNRKQYYTETSDFLATTALGGPGAQGSTISRLKWLSVRKRQVYWVNITNEAIL